jgi:hypothetical protein
MLPGDPTARLIALQEQAGSRTHDPSYGTEHAYKRSVEAHGDDIGLGVREPEVWRTVWPVQIQPTPGQQVREVRAGLPQR